MLSEVIVSSGGDSGLVHGLITVLLIGICLAIVYAVGRWFIEKLAAPPMSMTCWTGLFVLIIAILFINFLLGLTGHSFVRL